MKISDRAQRLERNSAIFALAKSNPRLPLKDIGDRFGLTAAGVSLILSGHRGKRVLNRIEKLERQPSQTGDKEFDAVNAVMSAIADLSEPARHRVVEYALARLGETTPEAP